MSEIVVREIGAGEIAVVAHLYGASFDEPYPEPVAASLLRTPGAWCHLAWSVETGTPLGFVIARSILDEAEILSIGTMPDARRQGVASTLLEVTFSTALRAKCRVVHLEVGEDNPGAGALYREIGFRATGRRENYYRRANRSRVAAILMTYDLTDQQ